MKRTVSIAAVTLLAAAVGCSNANKPSSQSLQPTPAVTQVQPAADQQQIAPAPDQAMAVDTSTPSQTPTDTATAASFSGGKYVVKAGDTLYRIAVAHYGSGKEWKKIAEANPGIVPTKLHVGQTLTLP